MSLINDALKKAQRERDEIARSAPPPPPRSALGETASSAPAPRRSPWIFVLAAAAIAAGSTWLTVRLTRPEAVVPVVAAAPTPAPATTPVVATPVASLPAPLPTLAPTPSPAPTPLMTISPAAEAARIQAVIDRLTIAAVRISESGNRALVNDRLLRVNDALEGLSGVRVKAIEADHIDFVDRFGNIYTKRR